VAPARPLAVTNDRQPHLDGMRAVASMYVVIFHAVGGFARQSLGDYRVLVRATAFGHEAVAVFIVLSGYCLMLPVVRADGERLPRTTRSFLARRAWRILPPYYAALLICLLLIANVGVLQRPGSGTIWDDSLPGLDLHAIGAHAFVVHNWFPEWAFQIDGPLWSVATEWQIYFFFPFILLPLWRRFGLPAAFVVASILGYAPLWLGLRGAHTAIPWYLALFALGMGAAATTRSSRRAETWLREHVSWGSTSAVVIGAALVGGWCFGPIWFRMKPWTDLLVGAATAAFLVGAAIEPSSWSRWLARRVLSSRPALGLGHISYSLYLIHLPVLALAHFAAERLGLTPLVHVLWLLTVGVTASVAVGALFFLMVERHFIGGLPRRSRPDERVGRSISPGG